jgi:hypothetical protein
METHYSLNNHVSRFYDAWRKLATHPQATTWHNNPLFPSTLSTEELTTARKEFRAIPEFFYTNHPHLPVITPDLYPHFEQATKDIPTEILLWSWCAGSSRLTSTMAGLPYYKAALFPVDLRYGWDLRNHHHQQLLTRANDIYTPFLTTIEPRLQILEQSRHKQRPTTNTTTSRRRDANAQVHGITQHSTGRPTTDDTTTHSLRKP